MPSSSSTTERSYTTDDKTGWGDGPWQDEPDKIQWVDAETGYDCLIVRNRIGSLCGYVGLPPEHPCHGIDYDDVKVHDEEYGYPDVHGGLTYAAGCQDDAPEDTGICHVPLDGRPDNVWWLGFDCAHGFDIAPEMEARNRARGESSFLQPGAAYRTVAYVKAECAKLARQLVNAFAADGET